MIRSTANPHVRYIRSLIARKEVRESERCFVIEGVRLAGQALAAGWTLVLALYDPHQLSTTEQGRALLEQLVHLPSALPAHPRAIAAATDTVHPQGIVAVVPRTHPQTFSRPTLPFPRRWLLLDGIQDPGNLGTLLRSAEAVGIEQVWCGHGTVDAYSPKVVRAAMGAHFFLPIHEVGHWSELEPALKAFPHVYAAVAGGTRSYDTVDWQHPSALILGNEAHGISPEGLAIATSTLTIPMHGQLASLNVAVAGSIILFEALRQLRQVRTTS